MRTSPKNLIAAVSGYVLALLFLVFLAAPLQYRYGMVGLLWTELGLLALALLGTAVFRAPWRQVFAFHRPDWRGVGGALLLWMGTYILVMLVSMFTMLLVPQQLTEVSAGITDLFSQVPLPVRYLLVAVAPAFCEEMLFRGYLLHHMQPMPVWGRVVLCGVLFGAFHLDPVRFLPTAILGIAISWAALRSGNLLYAMLIHLFNNSLSVLATLAPATNQTAAAEATQSVMTPAAFGGYFFLTSVSPWLIWAGSSLLRPKESPPPDRTRPAMVCLVISAACIAAGLVLAQLG